VIAGAWAENAIPLRSRSLQSFIHLPDPARDGPAFLDTVARLVRDEGCDTLIPTGDSVLLGIVPYYDQLARILHVGCPPPDVLRVALDKRLTFRAAE